MSAELAAPEAEIPLSPIADAPIPTVEEEAPQSAEGDGEKAATEEPEADKPPVEKDEGDSTVKRRIDRLIAKNAESAAREREALQRAADLEARLAALNPEEAAKPDLAEIAKQERERAKQEIREEERRNAFNHECNMTHAKGVAEFSDFDRSIDSLKLLGVMSDTLIHAAFEAGDAHKVLYALGRNPEEAERISGLSPERMGAAVAKFALKAVPTLTVKPVSKAPQPIKPIDGGASHVETDPNKMSMEEFDKRFPLPARH
jgi:hypothetical protein